jgi:hypothetical protein
MKQYYLGLITFLLFLNSANAQDFADEKSITVLKNTKYISPNKQDKSYAVVLTDNSFLNIKYNIIQDGELNSTYLFIKTPDGFVLKNIKEFNEKYLKDNAVFMCKTIGLNTAQTLKVENAIAATQIVSGSKSTLITVDLKGYDECSIVLVNSERLISCSFLFRRLL